MTEKYSLKDLIEDQVTFEKVREGTDGTLWDKNTIEYGLVRGVIGEAQEALEELEYLVELHILTPDAEELIKETHAKLVMEIIDIQIFMASIYAHAGLTADKVMELASKKMAKNRSKYAMSNFEGRTIAEGLQYSRDKWRMGSDLGSGDNRSLEEADELDYLATGAGSPS